MHGPLLLQDPGTEDKMRVSLTEKEWSFINEIILNIHSAEDNVRMRQTFFDLLRHGIHKADKTFKLRCAQALPLSGARSIKQIRRSSPGPAGLPDRGQHSRADSETGSKSGQTILIPSAS